MIKPFMEPNAEQLTLFVVPNADTEKYWGGGDDGDRTMTEN